jgi:hypothetical protein
MSLRKQGSKQREKLAMIRLRDEMQTEKPTMLNCSKDAHKHTSYSRYVFSFNIWVGNCEELIREDWKKLMGNLPIEEIPLPQNHIRKTIGG